MKLTKTDYNYIAKRIIEDEGVDSGFPAPYLKQVAEGRVFSSRALELVEKYKGDGEATCLDYSLLSREVARKTGKVYHPFYLKKVCAGDYQSSKLLKIVEELLSQDGIVIRG